MKNKGLNKIYFGIGMRRDYRTTNIEIYFHWFKLIHYAPPGVIMQRGRDYKGFILSKIIRIPEIGINI